jgi:hypothetical protein
MHFCTFVHKIYSPMDTSHEEAKHIWHYYLQGGIEGFDDNKCALLNGLLRYLAATH